METCTRWGCRDDGGPTGAVKAEEVEFMPPLVKAGPGGGPVAMGLMTMDRKLRTILLKMPYFNKSYIVSIPTSRYCSVAWWSKSARPGCPLRPGLSGTPGVRVKKLMSVQCCHRVLTKNCKISVKKSQNLQRFSLTKRDCCIPPAPKLARNLQVAKGHF